jgi:hypothetical protein
VPAPPAALRALLQVGCKWPGETKYESIKTESSVFGKAIPQVRQSMPESRAIGKKLDVLFIF